MEKKIINIHSTLNEWIDVNIIVSARDYGKAYLSCRRAWDKFWAEEDDETLGNIIETELKKSGITEYELEWFDEVNPLPEANIYID